MQNDFVNQESVNRLLSRQLTRLDILNLLIIIYFLSLFSFLFFNVYPLYKRIIALPHVNAVYADYIALNSITL